jgi:hypothetical protein
MPFPVLSLSAHRPAFIPACSFLNGRRHKGKPVFLALTSSQKWLISSIVFSLDNPIFLLSERTLPAVVVGLAILCDQNS